MQNKINVKTGDLQKSATEFALLTKANFASGKTILRLTKIARQVWQHIEDGDLAITGVYKTYGKFDAKINNYRVAPEKLSEIEPFINEIKDVEVEILGSKFSLDDFWIRNEVRAEGSIPNILTADLLNKLDWLIELSELD